MTMRIDERTEYECYGWIVLAINPTTEWTEADFDEGFDRV
jgi:hypothetical protein